MRLTAEPQDIFRRRYRILADGAPITEISVPAFGPSTATPIAGRAYHLRRTDALTDHFILETETGEAVASIARSDPLRRAFTVAVGARRLSLRAESLWRSGYLLLDGDQTVGWLRPAGPLRRGMEADLPDTLPLEARVFVLWVTLLLWRGRRVTRADAGA